MLKSIMFLNQAVYLALKMSFKSEVSACEFRASLQVFFLALEPLGKSLKKVESKNLSRIGMYLSDDKC